MLCQQAPRMRAVFSACNLNNRQVGLFEVLRRTPPKKEFCANFGQDAVRLLILTAPLESLKARHTFSGVNGISIAIFTPARERASATALEIAGIDPVVPASPHPLTPRGLAVDGTSWNAALGSGKSDARGMA